MKRLDAALALARKAAQDKLVVEKLLSDPDIADEVIGFHCQQAVEKLLKALLLGFGLQFPRTHNLDLLADLLADAGHPLPADLAAIEGFIPFAAQYRYEDEPNLQLDRDAALALVRRIRIHTDRELAALGG